MNGPEDSVTIFTVGHSNHPLAAFLALLRDHGIETVADVRSRPYSAWSPYFNRKEIEASLGEPGIGYLFLGAELGGTPEDGSFYDEKGFALYDRIASSDAFRNGLDRLLARARQARTALMCSEEDPSECHRHLLVARALEARGASVLHIRGDGRIEADPDVRRRAETGRGNADQGTLFDLREVKPWKSRRSVSPERRQRRSSPP